MRSTWSSALAAVFWGAGLASALPAQAGFTERVSVGTGGTQGDGVSTFGSLSADGRYVAFSSSSTDLVAGDTNRSSDVFVHDRQLQITTLVSRASSGALANGDSTTAAISADGRWVAFESQASNLDPADVNAWIDIYVHDRLAGSTMLVSRALSGQAGDGESADPSISADGRRIAFESAAPDLVAGDTNGRFDIFVAELPAGTLQRASLASDGTQGSADSGDAWISADGRCVVYTSAAPEFAALDTNGHHDVFVRVLATGATEVASTSTAGVFGDGPCAYPSCSADARFVVFSSLASNLVDSDTNGSNDVFVRDRVLGTLARISLGSGSLQGDSGSSNPFLSWDGRFLAFRSYATNFAMPDQNSVPDIFWRDLEQDLTLRVSVSTHDGEADGFNQVFGFAADGRTLVFHSFATNLVNDDTNQSADVFVRDVWCAVPWCESGPGGGNPAGVPSLWALGAALPGAATELHAQGAPPHAAGAWVLGTSLLALPIATAVLWPAPEFVLPATADAGGDAVIALAWPVGAPSGLAVHAQAWFLDPAGAQGLSASPGIWAAFP
jgi:Tol biopolymer transport system component